jgi:hypothetical protein
MLVTEFEKDAYRTPDNLVILEECVGFDSPSSELSADARTR